MQEQHCRRPHSATNFTLDEAVPEGVTKLESRSGRTLFPMFVVIAVGSFLLAAGASAAVHESEDPFTVEGPVVATPSRLTLPDRADLAARGTVSASLQSLVSSAAQLGLSGAQIPPHRATSLGLSARGPLDNPTDLSLSIVEDYPALVGLSRDDLLPLTVKDGGKITYVHFRQQIEGVPVLHSHVVFQWDRAGRLRSTGADVFVRELGTSPAPFISVWISPEDARTEALRGMPADLEVTEWEHEERAWLPLASSSDAFDLIPVWNIRFRTVSPAGWYDAIVDAETGTLLSRENRILFESLSGNVSALVETVSPGGPELILPLRDVFGQVEGIQPPFPTDAEGNFQTDVPAGEQKFIASLFGQHIFILDGLAGLTVPTDTVDVTVPGEIPFLWNDSNSSPGQRDAYYHGNVAYQEIRRIDDGPGMAPLDPPLRTDVDDPSSECNAFWDGGRMNFYAAGPNCPSIARIADVVYHEYGHAITQFTWWPLNAPSDMHEGFSDYFAATITGRPEIGVGFRGPNTFLREIETDRVWPTHISSDPHITGLIIAGALWDVRSELGREVTDKLWHFAGYAGAQNFHDYLVDVLVYDDDDADLSNGTPNFEVIVRNFRKHGIGDFSVSISAAELPDLESPDATIDGSVSISSLLPLDSTSLAFFYRVTEDPGFTRVALATVEGEARNYSFSFPTPDDGSTVHYYWAASNEEGVTATLPVEAPETTFSFFVGADVIPPVVSTERPPQVLAADASRFYFRTRVSDNSQRVGRQWAEYRIGDAGEIHEADLTPRSDGSFETSIDLVGIQDGDRFQYRVLAEDEAQTINRGAWPIEGFHEVIVRPGVAYDFEDEGSNVRADNDWEWGEAPEGFAYSGTHAWGTILEGRYSDSAVSTVLFGPIDLSGFDRAMLRFRHFYAIEGFWDGGNVQITDSPNPEDPNLRWNIMRPVGEYPFANISALGQPGFSGQLEDWETVTFPLDFYLDKTVYLRFVMGTDVGVNDLGWYFDELQVLQAQAWVDPREVSASEGEDEQVTLAWRMPRGIDGNSDRLLGFNIYRRVVGSTEAEVSLNAEPLVQFQFVDTKLDNAVAYQYRVTTAYDRGESDGALVTGNPFSATVGISVEALDVTISNYDGSDESVVVRNVGAGALEFDLFLADEGQTLEDVIAVYRPVSGNSDTTEIFLDATEISPVDVHSLNAFDWDNNGRQMLGVKIQGAAPWGNPLTDWGGVLFIDTDGDLSTSQGSFGLGWNEGTNIGWEYGIIFGSLPAQVGFPGVAFLFDAGRESQPVPLTEIEFPIDGDQITMSFPIDVIGSPEEVQMQLVVAPGVGFPPFDYVPNLPEAVNWLSRSPNHGRAIPSVGTVIEIEFGNEDFQNGTYQAQLIVRSNDRIHPEVALPVTMQIDRGLPAELASVVLSPSLAGMECEFSLSPAHVPTSVNVERALTTGTPNWERINAAPMVPDGDGVYRIVDRGVSLGMEYRYQFPIEFEDDLSQTYGPVVSTFDPPVPDLVSFLLESEISGMLLEFQVPDGVVAVGARVERSLDTDPAEWSELTETALVPDSTGTFSLLDQTVVDGIAYLYRFQVEVESGIVVSYGPYAQEFVAAFPAELPVEIASLEEALVVSATLGEEFNPLIGVWIDRREAGTEEWIRLTEVPSLPDTNGVVSRQDFWKDPWRDGVEAGVDYEYQFVVIVQGGRERAYGPYSATFVPPLPTVTTILPSRPNPFRDEVVFRIDLADAGRVRLELYDAAGRRRRVLSNEDMPAGAHQMIWDGRDDSSGDLPTGVYFARFEAGSVTKTMRVLRVQ